MFVFYDTPENGLFRRSIPGDGLTENAGDWDGADLAKIILRIDFQGIDFGFVVAGNIQLSIGSP